MIRLAILISGSGTTAQAVIKVWKKGNLNGIEPVVILASRPDAGGLVIAKDEGIATAIVSPNDYRSPSGFGDAMLNVLQKHRVDIVSQNGWLPLTPQSVIEAYKGKIINQHPGPLDPGRLDFGGKGMYGRRVTAARLAYTWISGSDFWTEATTHHVTEEFDEGKIIRIERLIFPSPPPQMTLAQLQNNPRPFIETTNRVAASLLLLEHQNVVATLKAYGKDGKFPVFQRDTPLLNIGDKPVLDQAKKLAIKLFPTG